MKPDECCQRCQELERQLERERALLRNHKARLELLLTRVNFAIREQADAAAATALDAGQGDDDIPY